jgi:dipeptidyl aminopeptidase/acylaminoacyl peptidase
MVNDHKLVFLTIFTISFYTLASIGGIYAADSTQTVGNDASTIKWNPKGAKTVFLTADGVSGQEADKRFVNRVASNLEQAGIDVIVDPEAPSPNQVPRAVKNAPTGSVAIIICCNCAGTIKDMCEGISGPETNGKTKKGYLYEYAKDLKAIIYVSVSSKSLNDINFLPKSSDDTFSPESFKGLDNPAEYIINSGITLIDNPKPSTPRMSNERADATSVQILNILT